MDMVSSEAGNSAKVREFDVVIIGAGFAGLAALQRLRDVMGYSVRVIEAGTTRMGDTRPGERELRTRWDMARV